MAYQDVFRRDCIGTCQTCTICHQEDDHERYAPPSFWHGWSHKWHSAALSYDGGDVAFSMRLRASLSPAPPLAGSFCESVAPAAGGAATGRLGAVTTPPTAHARRACSADGSAILPTFRFARAITASGLLKVPFSLMSSSMPAATLLSASGKNSRLSHSKARPRGELS
jgi:hypothetical protein